MTLPWLVWFPQQLRKKKEPIGCSHVSPHWYYTKFGKENKHNFFFPTRNKNGLQPGSSKQGVLLLTRPRSSGDFLCQKIGISLIDQTTKSLNTIVMLPYQSVFVNAFSIIVFYRRWLAACLSFDLLGLFAVDFMVALLLILSIAIFYGCPLFDTFHC